MSFSIQRLGILGGTFDPVHNGHLILAEQACEAFQLDRVLFLPAGNPSFKQGSAAPTATAADRLRMVELACQDNPHFAVSDLEVKRPGITYTVDTLRELRERYTQARFFYILGSDAAALLPSWYHADELATQATFLIATRWGARPLDQDVRARLTAASFDFQEFEVNDLILSSQQVRARFAADQSLRYLLPPPVYAYAEERNLYE
jgi:nicotinate-nucleotide adenylyltransferase